MNDILSTLDSKDESVLAAGLKELISQTYVIEEEYKQLKASHDNLLAMFDEIIAHLPEAVWVLDESCNVILQNNAASNELLQAINYKKGQDYELSLDDESYAIRRSKYAGKELIMATNITKEKRVERLQSMGQVAAQLAHEIRNPIGSLMLMASALARKSNPEQKQIIDDMQDAIIRVEQIIKNILQFSKGVQIRPKLIDAASLKEECLNLCLHSDNIQYEVEFERAWVNVDKALLIQVLSNLIYNAFDAPNCTAVRVHARVVNGGLYEIKVLDNGDKISNASRLFEAFYTTKLRGNGLGLAIAAAIVKAHNSTLYYEDEPKAFGFKLECRTALK